MRPDSLAARVAFALAAAAALGGALGWVWTAAARDWAAHLDRAARAGTALHAVLAEPALPDPAGLTVTPLPPGISPPAPAAGQRETRLSILTAGPGGAVSGPRVTLVIAATGRSFPVAAFDQTPANPAERLGEVLRTLARLCSDATVYARRDGGTWTVVRGEAVWSCAARPPDPRLPATLAALVAAALVLGALANQRAALERFVAALTDRFRGGGAALPLEGPRELRVLAEAANAMTAREHERLAERARILAGISHDLGGPTTRLRLRAAMIADRDLRARIEADLAQMGDMIDAVLTHTREQMAQEVPVVASVLALVQSVADDFADTGRPVRLIEPESVPAPAPASLFGGGGRPEGALAASDRRFLARCRPKALRRAVANLVENALKYGRRAEIALDGDAETIAIRVSDHGGGAIRAADLAELVAPFARGPNAARTPGSGMGLTIADGIARQHGGQLSHEDWAGGIVAVLTLRRA